MIRPALLALGLFLVMSSFAQTLPRPKLVVGLVVDQMRPDYLYRYYERYGNGGFRRLMREGFTCTNTFIPYTPTVTAAGHTTVYTGSVPALHGIMGNNWYDPEQRKVVYCTDDNTVQTVGSSSAAGQMSPRYLWSTTITDELRLATNFRNKTVAIALKDRGSILPGGHTSTGSYWFDNASGGWITSTFYMTELPAWVKAFNDRRLPDAYLKQSWNLLRPAASYVQSTADSTVYESKLPGEDRTFPHLTTELTGNKYETFRYLPAANTYTFDMARAAVEGENLGRSGQADFLAVSFSSPDYAGHAFGPNALELEDMYLRFDQDLAAFLTYLDTKLGKGQYLVFLTADHAAAHNPIFLRDRKIPAGVFDGGKMRTQLADSLQRQFGASNLILSTINYQIYLNDSVIRRNNLDKGAIKQYIKSWLVRQPGISHVVDLANLAHETLPEQIRMMLANGYNQRLSGDLQFLFKPAWLETWTTGTTHGVWNPYDAHIPLLWFGWGIKPGSTAREVYMSDIAATLATMLHVQMPNACIGKTITEVAR